jgi:hypothetical protein
MATNTPPQRYLAGERGEPMKRIVLTFGLISGAILAAMFAISVPLATSGRIDFDKSEIIGYASMVLAFLLVFFGIRSYRDNVNGGTITFGRAFKVGLLITLVCCAVVVISWEIVYFGFIPDFGEKYAAFTMETMREKGATEAEITAAEKNMAKFTELYKNPLINAGITFLEVFPVGLIVTLVSAAILRKKSTPGVGQRSNTTVTA